MKLQTKYFGEIEYEEEDLVQFPVGLAGFEDEHTFLFLPFAGSNDSMVCIQSVQTPLLAFVALNPFSLLTNYEPVLQESELALLGTEDYQELAYYVLCAVKAPVSDSTVNLRCPIVVHPQTREARQIIMDTDRYQMRHSLAEFQRKEAGTC